MRREHYVLGFLFDKNNKKVLLQQASCPWMQNRWNGIGGHIEEEETPHEAMKRESEEEIGFGKYFNWKHQMTMICPGGTVFIFSTSLQTFSILTKKDTKQITAIFSINELPKYRMNNIDWMINLCIENPTYPPVIETENLGI